ncbi:MAG: SAM-dependent methyltransferase [Geobacteraceae bacterium GWB2_52_12]|nr:MAG: SAM-dependent methyltransferase [Geobacteraceae bacterium GWB2_52_12]
MIQDPTDQYIAAILSQCSISGLNVVEIGCGKGRITRDLAKYARSVVAADPDVAALEQAQSLITAGNVVFLQVPTGVPSLPEGSCDVVLYTLSLHHVPVDEMPESLASAANLLTEEGVIIVVEPGEGGSFTKVKERFGAGSGNERPAREAAIRAMRAMEGWTMGETVLFRTLFQFDNEEDFFVNMLPGYRQQSEAFVEEVRQFLAQHHTEEGIILEAERRLNVLRRDLCHS